MEVGEPWSEKLRDVAKARNGDGGSETDPSSTAGRAAGPVESERARWDPKDGELSVGGTKPEETPVEVRSGTDVQIVRPTRV